MSDAERARLRDIAFRLGRRLTSKDDYLNQISDDIAAKAFEELLKAFTRTTINNPEAFMTWKMKNLIADALRQRKAEVSRLQIWNEEFSSTMAARKPPSTMDPRRRAHPVGLSADVISKEEKYMATRQALAMSAIMPDQLDRNLLADRFYNAELSISDLARKHGGRSPASMANYLRKLLGTEDEPGSLSSVRDAVGELSLKTADAFNREILLLDSHASVVDPLGGAMTYLEIASTHSPAHRDIAEIGLSRLRWIQRSLPSQRGLSNKILHRLTRAACFYVLESNDARHDLHDDLGLHDDIAVLTAVHHSIRRYRN